MQSDIENPIQYYQQLLYIATKFDGVGQPTKINALIYTLDRNILQFSINILPYLGNDRLQYLVTKEGEQEFICGPSNSDIVDDLE